MQQNRVVGVSLLVLICAMSSCKKASSTDSSSTSPTCPTLTGSSWVPNVSGVSAANHDDTGISVSSTTQSSSGDILGQTQSFSIGGASTVSFTFSVGSDLLTSGSISLVARLTTMASGLSGGAYPVLVSLTDPAANEYVNLNATCTGTGITDSGCGPASPSAFPGATSSARRQQWFQHQFGISSGITVNQFPTCNWASGSPTCDFNAQSWFSTGKLRTGTYTAKYVLVADSYSSVPSGHPATMSLTVVQKTDGDAGTGGTTRGAFDVNVILVGQQNVIDSRTAKGQQNLDALFTHLVDHFYTQNTSTMKTKIGAINVIEWGCDSGGNTYSTLSTTGMGTFFKTGSALVPAATEGKAVNVFLISSLTGGGNMTILGLSAGLVGSPLNGTESSGLVFATFDKLATFNPSCSSSCPIASQEPAFIDMGSTVSHEIGHFLGLNHLSEATGTQHDSLPTTPICTNITSGQTSTSVGSCLADTNAHPVSGQTCPSQCTSYSHSSSNTSSPGTYCPSIAECQFNHVMWWTGKNYDYFGNGDGNLFSSDSGVKVGYNPYVR